MSTSALAPPSRTQTAGRFGPCFMPVLAGSSRPVGLASRQTGEAICRTTLSDDRENATRALVSSQCKLPGFPLSPPTRDGPGTTPWMVPQMPRTPGFPSFSMGRARGGKDGVGVGDGSVMRRGCKRTTQRWFVFGAAGNSLSLWAQRARVIGPQATGGQGWSPGRSAGKMQPGQGYTRNTRFESGRRKRGGSTKRSLQWPQVTASSKKLPPPRQSLPRQPTINRPGSRTHQKRTYQRPRGSYVRMRPHLVRSTLIPSHNGAPAVIGGIARRETRDEQPTATNTAQLSTQRPTWKPTKRTGHTQSAAHRDMRMHAM
jgi:hypothetical protein